MLIDFPFHGAVLDDRHGVVTDGGLRVTVRGQAAWNAAVTVNGAPADMAGESFSAAVTLTAPETDIVAVAISPDGVREHRLRVVWDRHSAPRYRFSIDDNLFFLRDLAQKRSKSLFDCFYLAILKRLHDRYGTRFSLNLFYTDDEGFDLSQFPDRYRGEWANHADWLRLTFHSHTEFPDRPYMSASPATLAADYDRVATEVHRFAGEASFCPATVIHWGVLPARCFPVLRERGVRALSGFFSRLGGVHDVSYLLDPRRCALINRYEAAKDFESGIVFSQIDLCCNCVAVADTVPALEAVAADPRRSRIMDIFTHEQYFWPFYHNYLPDHEQRLDTALRWLTEHGYQPVWLHEGLLGGPEA